MSHDHSHAPSNTSIRRLGWTLGLVLAYAGAEVAGGLMSGSLALIADAGHMLSDAASLALTMFAIHFARRPASATRTFGYYRAEILAALTNGVALIVVALLVFIEAIERFSNPTPVEAPTMLMVAAGGLVINLVGLWLLRGGNKESLNVRGAWLHVLTDALGSAQAIAAGVLIWLFGWYWVDPLASVLISILVVYSAWSLLRQSVAVLMEGAPGHIDVDLVRKALQEIPGVDEVHDLHIWTITSGFVALSAHLVVPDEAVRSDVMTRSDACLTQFGISHSTLQLDVGKACDQAHHHLS